MMSENARLTLNESAPQFELLYQDEWILAVNKRAYIPVAPSKWTESREPKDLPNPDMPQAFQTMGLPSSSRPQHEPESLLERVQQWLKAQRDTKSEPRQKAQNDGFVTHLQAQRNLKSVQGYTGVQDGKGKEGPRKENGHLREAPDRVMGTLYGGADGGSHADTTHFSYLGLVHRIDQPVTGVVLFARDPTTLELLNRQFRERQVYKLYWAVTEAAPPEGEGTLEHYIIFDPKRNKSRIAAPSSHPNQKSRAKKAILRYRIAGRSERYFFLEIELITGRPHQIRAQLAAIGGPVKGDLKYGARRSNPGGGILLHARSIRFNHPVTGNPLSLTAEPPPAILWGLFTPTA